MAKRKSGRVRNLRPRVEGVNDEFYKDSYNKAMKNCTGDYDLGYFKEYPAAMFEAMTRLNPTEFMNGTTPHYGPLLYVLAKILGAHNALEIGVAEGWSSGFMSWAIKENNSRFGMSGRYWGLDIDDKSALQKAHDEIGLPSSFIHHKKGSVDWLMNHNVFEKNSLDLVFIDGLHYGPYVETEVELIYPLLKDNGNGYLVLHDIYAFIEKTWPKIEKDPRYKWESLRFLPNYGLGILRKMENYDHSKTFWPDGDQVEFAKQQGVA